MVVRVVLVPVLVRVMVTPGTTAPVVSLTCPKMVPLVCASTVEAANNEKPRNIAIRLSIWNRLPKVLFECRNLNFLLLTGWLSKVLPTPLLRIVQRPFQLRRSSYHAEENTVNQSFSDLSTRSLLVTARFDGA